jgi:hypothetical protein
MNHALAGEASVTREVRQRAKLTWLSHAVENGRDGGGYRLDPRAEGGVRPAAVGIEQASRVWSRLAAPPGGGLSGQRNETGAAVGLPLAGLLCKSAALPGIRAPYDCGLPQF